MLIVFNSCELGDVDMVQAGDLYRGIMKESDRKNLASCIVGCKKNAGKRSQLRQCALVYMDDAKYGERVAVELGLSLTEVRKPAAMPREDRAAAGGK